MKIEFTNAVDVGTVASGATIFDELPINYRIEWRLRQDPYLGMKQPTPRGGFLGSECILVLEVNGVRARRYFFQIFCDGEAQGSGFTNDVGESGDLHIKMPYQGNYIYHLEISGPVNAEDEIIAVATE